MIEAGSVMAIGQKIELIIYQNDKDNVLPEFSDILTNKIYIVGQYTADIGEEGKLPFREFMDLSLYESNQGYYTKNNIGPRGDFITSPSVHPLFGSLIGKQIIQIWELMDKPNPFYIYEFGGAPGTLAHDLTNYCSLTKPEFLDQLKYIIIDPSPISERNIAHFSSIKNLTEIHKQGCIISNELLDSLPTRRFKKIFNSFKEIFIDIHDEKLEFKFVEITDSKLLESLNFNYQTIPDGSIIEFNDKLSILAKTFDTLLEKGFVLTIDYGFNSPNIKENIIRYNSFRCYYNHNSDQNPLINIGNKIMETEKNL